MATKLTDEDKAHIAGQHNALVAEGMSQADAAEQLGYSLSTIRRYKSVRLVEDAESGAGKAAAAPKVRSSKKPKAKTPKRVPTKNATVRTKLSKKHTAVATNLESQDVIYKINVIQLPESIVISINTEPMQLTSDNPRYGELKTFINNLKGRVLLNSTEVNQLKLIVQGKEIVSIQDWSMGALTISNGIVRWDGTPVNNKMQAVILTHAKDGNKTKLESFSKFIEKVKQAISWKVTHRLYDFLVANDLEIDEDGNVLAFKVVTSDFKDKHTKTIDNSIGVTISCPRNEVDDRDNVTCSNGYHVCSSDYIKSFFNNGDRVTLVVVDPRDFVSVPVDYNSTKARVCKYSVLRDITDEYNKKSK